MYSSIVVWRVSNTRERLPSMAQKKVGENISPPGICHAYEFEYGIMYSSIVLHVYENSNRQYDIIYRQYMVLPFRL